MAQFKMKHSEQDLHPRLLLCFIISFFSCFSLPFSVLVSILGYIQELLCAISRLIEVWSYPKVGRQIRTYLIPGPTKCTRVSTEKQMLIQMRIRIRALKQIQMQILFGVCMVCGPGAYRRNAQYTQILPFVFLVSCYSLSFIFFCKFTNYCLLFIHTQYIYIQSHSLSHTRIHPHIFTVKYLM